MAEALLANGIFANGGSSDNLIYYNVYGSSAMAQTYTIPCQNFSYLEAPGSYISNMNLGCLLTSNGCPFISEESSGLHGSTLISLNYSGSIGVYLQSITDDKITVRCTCSYSSGGAYIIIHTNEEIPVFG